MKKSALLSLFILSIAAIFTACNKGDNSKIPALTRFPLPQLVKKSGTDQIISAQNPNSFSAKFTVGLFFPHDAPPKKFDVVIMKNEGRGNIKMIQANVTTFPIEITITGPQLATLFSTPIVLGDRFDISVDVTTENGVKYEAFPVIGNAYAAGVAEQPGSSTFVRYEAVCLYNSDQYQGNFEVITDEWGDYGAGDIVQLTKIDVTHFSFNYRPDNPQPIIITVNPNTNEVSVTKQVYGSGYPPDWTFGNISAESVASVENFVAPCAGTFSIILKHTVSAGSFGQFKIVLKKV